MMEYILWLTFIKIFLLKKLIVIIKKYCDKNMRMKMTNDNNDNDSSNVNETIKIYIYFFFTKKFYKHSSSIEQYCIEIIEVIRLILNILFFFYEKNLHAQKTQKKNHKKHKNTNKQTKRQYFYMLKKI